MNILVTGAAGRSGAYFLQELQTRGAGADRYRLLIRKAADAERIAGMGLPAEIVRGDLTDPDTLDRAMQGVDTVLHIAGIQRTEPVAEAAVRCGVQWLIAVHTTGVYSRYKAAGAEYRRIDAAVWALCKDHGVALTVLRPTMIYGGPDDYNIWKFIRMVDRLRLFPVVSGGNFLLQPVHRGDLGRAYFDVIAAGAVTRGRDYILSGDRPVTLLELLHTAADALGRRTAFVSVPFFLAYGGAWAAYLVSLGRVDYREKVQRLVEDRAYPHDEATRDFGYAPRGFSEGLRAEAQEYMAQKRRA